MQVTFRIYFTSNKVVTSSTHYRRSNDALVVVEPKKDLARSMERRIGGASHRHGGHRVSCIRMERGSRGCYS